MNKQDYAKLMERRQFLKLASMGALGAAALAACSSGDDAVDSTIAEDSSLPELEWEIATSWPTSLDTIYGGATTFAERVSAMTGGSSWLRLSLVAKSSRLWRFSRTFKRTRSTVDTPRPTTT